MKVRELAMLLAVSLTCAAASAQTTQPAKTTQAADTRPATYKVSLPAAGLEAEFLTELMPVISGNGNMVYLASDGKGGPKSTGAALHVYRTVSSLEPIGLHEFVGKVFGDDAKGAETRPCKVQGHDALELRTDIKGDGGKFGLLATAWRVRQDKDVSLFYMVVVNAPVGDGSRLSSISQSILSSIKVNPPVPGDEAPAGPVLDGMGFSGERFSVIIPAGWFVSQAARAQGSDLVVQASRVDWTTGRPSPNFGVTVVPAKGAEQLELSAEEPRAEIVKQFKAMGRKVVEDRASTLGGRPAYEIVTLGEAPDSSKICQVARGATFGDAVYTLTVTLSGENHQAALKITQSIAEGFQFLKE